MEGEIVGEPDVLVVEKFHEAEDISFTGRGHNILQILAPLFVLFGPVLVRKVLENLDPEMGLHFPGHEEVFLGGVNRLFADLDSLLMDLLELKIVIILEVDRVWDLPFYLVDHVVFQSIICGMVVIAARIRVQLRIQQNRFRFSMVAELLVVLRDLSVDVVEFYEV